MDGRHNIASGESAKAVGKTPTRYERIAQDRTREIASRIDDLF